MGDSNLPQWLTLGLELTVAACSLLGAIGGWVSLNMRQTYVTHSQLDSHDEKHGKLHDAIERRLDNGDGRFRGLAEQISALPGRSEHDAMKAQLAAVDRIVSALSAKIDGMSDLLQRIERPLNILVEEKLRAHE